MGIADDPRVAPTAAPMPSRGSRPRGASRAGRAKDITLEVYRGVSSDRILLIAAGVTFYAILALFPGIAVLVSIYGLFGDPSRIAEHLNTIANIAPGGAVEILSNELTRLAHQNGTALGIGFLVSLLVSLWTANAGMSALFDALTVAFDEKERRGLIAYYAQTLAFTVGSILLMLVLLVIVVATPVVLNVIPHPGETALLLAILRWPALLVLVMLALAVVYRFGPSRGEPRWRWFTSGTVFAAAVWLGASALFSWYVANFGSYNKTYGSLGAIIGFMTWMWVSTVVVLVGAKLDAVITRRRAPPHV